MDDAPDDFAARVRWLISEHSDGPVVCSTRPLTIEDFREPLERQWVPRADDGVLLAGVPRG